MLRIKELLKDKGITQKDLARKLEITEVGLYKILAGNPTVSSLQKIADKLDVDVKDLFYSTKDSNKKTIYIKKGDKYISVGELKLL